MHRVKRMRLKAAGHAASPTKALEPLRRLQHHRATIGNQAYAGLGKTTPEQLSLFEALKLPKPTKPRCTAGCPRQSAVPRFTVAELSGPGHPGALLLP